MRKELKPAAVVFPMPVLMIATYNEDGSVDVMNAAWGINYENDQVLLNISEGHRTTANIHRTKAFTVALADQAHMAEADYFGLVSANRDGQKFARSGLHAVKSEKVNAPVIREFPVTMECEWREEEKAGYGVVGKVVGLSVDEAVLDEQGHIDPAKLNALVFDTFTNSYYTIGSRAGKAFAAGLKIKEQ
jgi:flavin reductase (DIM6/NTAB) family NADH-FMN oxidoreductase RutF